MQPAITTKNLTVHIKQNTILDNINLAIPSGTISGLLGPSGSGKTTLIRSLVGLQSITNGSAHLLTFPAGSDSLKSKVGYMTQSPAIYDDLSVVENIRYFATLTQQPRERVDQVIEEVSLSDLAKRRAAKLSGGQRARVSLAIALINRPDVLLLDEPTVGLDPLLRQKLWSHFRKLAGNGVTLLIASHVMDEADYCDQIVLLRQGRVLANNTTDTLRKQTSLSSMNDIFIKLIGNESQ